MDDFFIDDILSVKDPLSPTAFALGQVVDVDYDANGESIHYLGSPFKTSTRQSLSLSTVSGRRLSLLTTRPLPSHSSPLHQCFHQAVRAHQIWLSSYLRVSRPSTAWPRFHHLSSALTLCVPVSLLPTSSHGGMVRLSPSFTSHLALTIYHRPRNRIAIDECQDAMYSEGRRPRQACGLDILLRGTRCSSQRAPSETLSPARTYYSMLSSATTRRLATTCTVLSIAEPNGSVQRPASPRAANSYECRWRTEASVILCLSVVVHLKRVAQREGTPVALGILRRSRLY